VLGVAPLPQGVQRGLAASWRRCMQARRAGAPMPLLAEPRILYRGPRAVAPGRMTMLRVESFRDVRDEEAVEEDNA
jgi:hypothetical protein